MLAVKCFAKTRTVISYQGGPYFDRISGCDDSQLLKQNSFAWQICTDEIVLLWLLIAIKVENKHHNYNTLFVEISFSYLSDCLKLKPLETRNIFNV